MEIDLYDVIRQKVEEKKAENKIPDMIFYRDIINHVLVETRKELSSLKKNGKITLHEGLNDWMVGLQNEGEC